MAEGLPDLVSRIRLDTSPIAGALRQVTQQLGGLQKDIASAGNQMDRTLNRVAAGAAGAFAVKTVASFEQTQIAFEGILGSGQKAEAFLNRLQDFAAKTPFEFPQLTKASQQLLGVGFAAEEVIPILNKIGNVTAALGVGSEGVERVVRALGQMAGRGKVASQELIQISEAIPGFSAIAAVAESMGISTAEAFKRVENGAVTADAGIEAILEGMQKFPGAAGAMERQSKTLAGTFSTLKDTTREALIETLGPALPGITTGIRGLGNALGTVTKSFAALPTPLQSATSTMGTFAIAAALIGPRAKAAAERLNQLQASTMLAANANLALQRALNLVGRGLLIVGLVESWRAAFDQLNKSSSELVDKLIETGARLKDFDELRRDLGQFGVPDVETFAIVADKDQAAGQRIIDQMKAVGKETAQYESILNSLIQEEAKHQLEEEAMADRIAQTKAQMKGGAEDASKLAEELEELDKATRKAADAQFDLQDATHGITQAQRNLTDAQDRLNELIAEGAVDWEQVEEAQHRLIDSNESLTDADQNLIDSRDELNELLAEGAVDAEKVADAERGVADAIRGTEDAQRRLIEAEERLAELRQGSKPDDIAEAELKLAAARREAQEAPIRLAEADQRLDEVRREGDPEKTRLAELNVEAAQDAVVQSAIDVRQAEEDLNEIRQQGQPGTREVVDAERDVEDARYQVEQAIRGEADAQRELQEALAGDPEFQDRVAKAREAVSDAERSVFNATRDRNQAQRDLNEALAGDPDFQRNMADARYEVEDAERAVERSIRDAERAALDAAAAEQALYLARLATKDITPDARAEQEAYIQSLDRFRDTLAPDSPLRRNMDALIATLEERFERQFKTELVIDDIQARASLTQLFKDFNIPARFQWGAGLEARAHGGPVSGGWPYIVGERGPELFIPDIGGRVIDASRTAAMVSGSSGGARGGDIWNIYPPAGLDVVAVAKEVERQRSWRESHGG